MNVDAKRLSERVRSRGGVSTNQDERLAKFFPPMSLGEITEPATIVDMYGLILAWHLPDIISDGRVVSLVLFGILYMRFKHSYSFQKEVNLASQEIGDLLKASRPRAGASRAHAEVPRPRKTSDATGGKKRKAGPKKINWRIDPKNFKAPDNPQFIPGSVEFSPGWFAQAHEAKYPSFNIVGISHDFHRDLWIQSYHPPLSNSPPHFPG
jgi:hypothetical protein